MKIVQFQYNSDKVGVVEIPKPTPSDDEVLVKVHYSAHDTATREIIDRHWMASFIHSMNKKDPLYLGYHFSGTVESIGGDSKE